ncbi:IS66 family insertion sequence element accessory protein TnpB, partial [Mesorhizobium sp. VK22B]
MIGPTGAVKVMVATKPVDFRKGAEGLAALVRETMGADPFLCVGRDYVSEPSWPQPEPAPFGIFRHIIFHASPMGAGF